MMRYPLLRVGVNDKEYVQLLRGSMLQFAIDEQLENLFSSISLNTYTPSLAYFVMLFQAKYTLKVDGIVGVRTWDMIRSVYNPMNEQVRSILVGDKIDPQFLLPRNLPPYEFLYTGGMSVYELPYPMRLAWSKKTKIARTTMANVMAPHLCAALRDVLKYYGMDRIVELGLDLFGGVFNDRNMKGGTRKSSHAYAGAIDMHPEGNAWLVKPKDALFSKPEYYQFCKIMQKYGFRTLEGDQMHYQWISEEFQ